MPEKFPSTWTSLQGQDQLTGLSFEYCSNKSIHGFTQGPFT